VRVPDGCFPGDLMSVEVGNISYDVTVPTNTAPGDTIEILLPRLSQEVDVVVPQGVRPGEIVLIELDSGSFEVRVPAGAFPGMVVRVDLPECTHGVSQDQQQQLASHASSSVQKYRIGQRVQVLRSDGSFSAAFIVDYHEPSGLYQVELHRPGSGIFKEGVTEDDIGSSWEALYLPTSKRRQYASSSSSESEN
jgi:hypothetical protein